LIVPIPITKLMGLPLDPSCPEFPFQVNALPLALTINGEAEVVTQTLFAVTLTSWVQVTVEPDIEHALNGVPASGVVAPTSMLTHAADAKPAMSSDGTPTHEQRQICNPERMRSLGEARLLDLLNILAAPIVQR
jgi:hypothetical protein